MRKIPVRSVQFTETEGGPGNPQKSREAQKKRKSQDMGTVKSDASQNASKPLKNYKKTATRPTDKRKKKDLCKTGDPSKSFSQGRFCPTTSFFSRSWPVRRSQENPKKCQENSNDETRFERGTVEKTTENGQNLVQLNHKLHMCGEFAELIAYALQ